MCSLSSGKVLERAAGNEKRVFFLEVLMLLGDEPHLSCCVGGFWASLHRLDVSAGVTKAHQR